MSGGAAIRSLLAALAALAAMAGLGLAVPAHAEAAVPQAILNCAAPDARQIVKCDYRQTGGGKLQELSFEVGGAPRKVSGAGLFPAPGQTAAILFLIDISDAQRAPTVARNVAAVRAVMSRLKPYEKAGLAVFDTDVHMLAPLGSTPQQLGAALDQVQAKGVATEFYKSLRKATDLLAAFKADRKGIILFSDGKAEDRAYNAQDAIAAAKAAGVSILGLGYAERPQDSPYLQSLEQLGEATGGGYAEVPAGTVLPDALGTAPFGFVETGGHFQFAAADIAGRQNLTLQLKFADGKIAKAEQDFDFSAGRKPADLAQAFVRTWWPALLGGTLAFALLAALLLIRLRRRPPAPPAPPPVYAWLEELDGGGTRHPLTAAATTIGRSEGNDICLANGSVSGSHATIYRRGGGWQIVDLDSTNGTLVNDQPQRQSPLISGDLLELGEVRLRFIVAPAT